MNVTPIFSPFTQLNEHRRYARPGDDKRRKNSFKFSPSIESVIVKVASVGETSLTEQPLRHVPSIAIMCAGKPFSNATRASGLLVLGIDLVSTLGIFSNARSFGLKVCEAFGSGRWTIRAVAALFDPFRAGRDGYCGGRNEGSKRRRVYEITADGVESIIGVQQPQREPNRQKSRSTQACPTRSSLGRGAEAASKLGCSSFNLEAFIATRCSACSPISFVLCASAERGIPACEHVHVIQYGRASKQQRPAQQMHLGRPSPSAVHLLPVSRNLTSGRISASEEHDTDHKEGCADPNQHGGSLLGKDRCRFHDQITAT
jgi:hypothetical protein